MPRRLALVTGGNRGIGAAVCRRLAREGAAVLVTGRDDRASAAVASEIVAEGGAAWPLRLDVADPDSVLAALRQAYVHGPIDWLVNNAGIAESAPLSSGGDELFARHMDVNFHGARRLTEALLPGMKERGHGRIVNMASSAGLRGYAYVAAYCASKFALVGYTLAAADELKETGVKVNAVCPWYVQSPMLERSIDSMKRKTGKSETELRQFLQGQNPGGRLVTPEEVADAVAFLLTGEENGALVELDGSDERRIHRPNRRREA